MKAVHILIFGEPEPVKVTLKRDFGDGIKLRTERWRDDPGLSGWVQGNDKCSYKRRAEGDVTWQRRSPGDHGGRDWREAATSPGTQMATGSWENQGADSLKRPEKTSPANTLM